MKRSGYEECYAAVKAARLAEPVDTRALEEIRDHFGWDLYSECLNDIRNEIHNQSIFEKLVDVECDLFYKYSGTDYRCEEIRKAHLAVREALEIFAEATGCHL
jgi:hypothetical protein